MQHLYKLFYSTVQKIFIIICISINYQIAYAQKNVPPLERLVSIRLQNTTTETALEQIAEQGDVEFSYSPSVINPQKRVDIAVENKTIRETLNQIFQGTVKYKNRSNYVILTKQNASKHKKITISGYILDNRSQKKISQVSVYERLSLVSAISNQYGFYQIQVSTDKPTITLSFSKENYPTKSLTINTIENSFQNISLEPILPPKIEIDPLKRTEVFTTVFQDSLNHLDSSNFVNFLIPVSQRTHSRNLTENFLRKFQVSFLPFLGSNHRLSGNVVNDYSFNALVGYSAGTKKFEIAGLMNVNRGRVEGWQIGGIGNLTGEEVHGVQIGGILNAVKDSVSGVQIAGQINVNGRQTNGIQIGGIANFSGGTMKGIQIAGILNVDAHSVEGIQVGGIANFVRGSTYGVQVSGILNANGRQADGVQVAGIANFSGGGLKGAQVAGITNIALDSINGTQVSAIFNFAKRVKRGVQVGLFNYADSAKHLTQIGMINFVRRGGYKCIELSVNELFPFNFTIRSGTPGFYNLYALGLRPMAERPLWYYGYGLGITQAWRRGWGMNEEFGYYSLARTLGKTGGMKNHIVRLQITVSKKIGKRWAIAGGPSANLNILQIEHPDYQILKNLFSLKIWESIDDNTHWLGSLGGQIGLRFFFP